MYTHLEKLFLKVFKNPSMNNEYTAKYYVCINVKTYHQEELRQYPAVYQNFEDDIYNSLQRAITLLNKYQKNIFL